MSNYARQPFAERCSFPQALLAFAFGSLLILDPPSSPLPLSPPPLPPPPPSTAAVVFEVFQPRPVSSYSPTVPMHRTSNPFETVDHFSFFSHFAYIFVKTIVTYNFSK